MFDAPEFYTGPAALFRDSVALPYLERQAAERNAATWRAELEKPLPKLDDPATRCRVLTATFQHRERIGEPTYTPKVGDIITLPKSEARGAVALGRVELI
jgi:hypothetical protein